jgi:hypothetical protein
MAVSVGSSPHFGEVSERAHENLVLLYGGDSRRAAKDQPEMGRASASVWGFAADAAGEPADRPRLD